MASGFGYSGGPSRCFAYWQEFSKCYASTDNPKECRPQSADYLECLHGTKKKARQQQVEDEFRRQLKDQAKEGRKEAEIHAGGAAVGVGLIPQGGGGEGESK